MEEGTQWEATSWNAICKPSEDQTYQEVIASIKKIADAFGIEVDLSDVAITPLHFLLHKYLPQQDSVLEQLTAKISTIQPEVTNLHNLMRLEKEGRDQAKKEPNSFLDGGLILLWCLYSNNFGLLKHFL